MTNPTYLGHAMPVAPLKIAALESCIDLGKKVNDHIIDFRRPTLERNPDSPIFSSYRTDSYLVECNCPRFGSGEAKGMLNESIRGSDLFIMADVKNYSLTYKVNGMINHMSPDDHYQDIKRIISAANGKAKRLNVIMPFLYMSRQHNRNKRESLDCAIALEELISMGVDNIMTFDAHDPKVQNAVPLTGFDNFTTHYQFVKAILRGEPDIVIDKDHLVIVSPDEGAMHRAIFLSNVLGVDIGIFYKRRDYSLVIGGKNPLVANEFLGPDIKGKDVIVIDDMISSGGRVLSVSRQLKDLGAKKVIICTTFGLFTDGFDRFDEYYEKEYFHKLITTNLTYLPPEAFTKPYFVVADLSKYIALIIDSLNHNTTISSILNPTEKIHNYLKKNGKI